MTTVFLKRAAVNQGIEWEREGIDTLKLCRIFMPEGESKALPQACRYYQVDMGITTAPCPMLTGLTPCTRS